MRRLSVIPMIRTVLTLGAGSLVVAGLGLAAPAQAASGADVGKTSAHQPSWQLRPTGSTSHFRGLSPVSRQVVWISGYDGLVLRTVDGGRSWIDASPAGASALQFRDIAGFDRKHAVAMAAGSGTDSRLYVTAD